VKTITIGWLTLAYWVGFYAFVFYDGYLTWPSAGLLLKVLLPIALGVNIAGMVLAVIRFPAEKRSQKVAALTLHGAPLLAGVGFLWWLFFGVRI
jgi:hypothetical protein